MRTPQRLKPGSRIALTAFSSGISDAQQARLNLAIKNLVDHQFEVIEGKCLRNNEKHVSADKFTRAAELEAFLCDNSIDAIFPPWGGELAIELLPLLNYSEISNSKPKWILGFSDVSTLAVALTVKCGWVTVHGSNLMELIEHQTERLTSQTLSQLTHQSGDTFTQMSSEQFQRHYIDFEQKTDAILNLTEKTLWKRFATDEPTQFEGRLLGGCLDILQHLFGTEYFDLDAFRARYNHQKVILYVENAELSPTDLARVFLSMKFHRVFDHLAGILIGRNSAEPVDAAGYSDLNAMLTGFSDLSIPILFDVDIGHQPPNLVLMNGAFAMVSFQDEAGSIQQTLP